MSTDRTNRDGLAEWPAATINEVLAEARLAETRVRQYLANVFVSFTTLFDRIDRFHRETGRVWPLSRLNQKILAAEFEHPAFQTGSFSAEDVFAWVIGRVRTLGRPDTPDHAMRLLAVRWTVLLTCARVPSRRPLSEDDCWTPFPEKLERQLDALVAAFQHDSLPVPDIQGDFHFFEPLCPALAEFTGQLGFTCLDLDKARRMARELDAECWRDHAARFAEPETWWMLVGLIAVTYNVLVNVAAIAHPRTAIEALLQSDLPEKSKNLRLALLLEAVQFHHPALRRACFEPTQNAEDAPSHSAGPPDSKRAPDELLDALPRGLSKTIVEFLWSCRHGVDWDTVAEHCWDDPPSEPTIHKALKRAQSSLGDVHDRFRVELEISKVNSPREVDPAVWRSAGQRWGQIKGHSGHPSVPRSVRPPL